MITYMLVAIAILGWVMGAFVNYLSDVLPYRRRFTSPFCPHCQARQAWLNYLVYPRRCESCGKRRRWRVWVVELLYIALSVWLWSIPPERLGFWIGLTLLTYFGVVVVIDIEHRLIMHPVSLFGAVLALAVGIKTNGVLPTLGGGAIAFIIMWVLYLLGEYLMRLIARLRKQTLSDVALGFGDVNLSGIVGLLLGWNSIFAGLILAIFIGGAISLVYMLVMLALRKYQVFMALPYGPFLVAGALVMLF